MRNFILIGAAALALNLGAGAAGAAVVVSNLADAQAGLGGIYQGTRPQSWAQQFTTGNQAYLLTDIIVPLGNDTGGITPSATLLSDSGSNTPGGTVLTSFAIPTIPDSGVTDITLTPALAIVLAANTSYWLLLSGTGASASNRYQWAYTNASEPGLTRFAVTTNGGATYSVLTNGPFLIQVDGTAVDTSDVPEPASWAMMTAGFLVAGAALRRKRSATPANA